MGYEAAEQAYGDHRFAEAQELLNEHLTAEPNDPHALLLQAYIHFYGFQDTAAAASSYRRVLELEAEGPYQDLAREGLKHCPVRERQAQPVEPEPAPTSNPEPAAADEQPAAAPWLAELQPEPDKPEQLKAKAAAEPEPDKAKAAPQAAVSYAMAEQAYQKRDFSAAQQLLNALLAQSPNDLRCLLLQGYVSSFGFQDEPAAINSYQRVLALEAEGPYRELAIKGLSQNDKSNSFEDNEEENLLQFYHHRKGNQSLSRRRRSDWICARYSAILHYALLQAWRGPSTEVRSVAILADTIVSVLSP